MARTKCANTSESTPNFFFFQHEFSEVGDAGHRHRALVEATTEPKDAVFSFCAVRISKSLFHLAFAPRCSARKVSSSRSICVRVDAADSQWSSPLSST